MKTTTLVLGVIAAASASASIYLGLQLGDDSDYQTRLLDWQADYSQRVQARVEPLLNGQQVVQYRQAVEAQNARRAQQQARAAARRNAANNGQ